MKIPKSVPTTIADVLLIVVQMRSDSFQVVHHIHKDIQNIQGRHVVCVVSMAQVHH